jgi:hypothetical protein
LICFAGQKTFDSVIDRISKEKRQQVECTQMVESCLRHFDEISFIELSQIEAEVPEYYFSEIRNLYFGNEEFRRSVFAYVGAKFPPVNGIASRHYYYNEYVMYEIPILLYLHYSRGLIDVYPGETSQTLIDLDLDKYDSDIPRIIADKRRKVGMLYVEIAKR